MNEVIRGCMVIVSIAIATGHYDYLRKWAIHEAGKPMTPLPYFFPQHEKSAEPKFSVSYRTKTHVRSDR